MRVAEWFLVAAAAEVLPAGGQDNSQASHLHAWVRIWVFGGNFETGYHAAYWQVLDYHYVGAGQ